MEAVGSLNSLVDYGGLGDSDIEDLDEEAFEKKATSIVARSWVPVTKPLQTDQRWILQALKIKLVTEAACQPIGWILMTLMLLMHQEKVIFKEVSEELYYVF